MSSQPNTEGKQKDGLRWVSTSNGRIPPGALAQGVDRTGLPLFIGRGAYKGGVHPGKAAPHVGDGGFQLSWGGRAHSLNEYQILCGDIQRTCWVPVHGSVQGLIDRGVRLVDGGNEADGSTPLFIAKAQADGAVVLGKCGPHIRNGMSYPDAAGAERDESKYMVLAHL
ncbi:hypothetical protein EV175_000125 [Coemansia sp. RSA 1933]|nr:hypothetical protein EV175_000125 [Coemansia sp. RSA 1933]